MAFDPVKEDYQRLILRFARTQVGDEDSIATLMKDFNWRFSNDRNSLPQTDEDRAFNLVAQAAEIVDYRLPFVEESQAQALIEQGKRLLNQAIQLDPNCFDAQRMLHASNSRLFDAYYQFLVEKLTQVEAACNQKAQESSQGLPAEQAELAQRLAINPYKRWLATLSSRALICGRTKTPSHMARNSWSLTLPTQPMLVLRLRSHTQNSRTKTPSTTSWISTASLIRLAGQMTRGFCWLAWPYTSRSVSWLRRSTTLTC